MALRIYEWRGKTYQIAEEDLGMFPGAKPVDGEEKKPAPKKKKTPANKARQTENK